METLDCRKLPGFEAARAITDHFNKLAPGARFEALIGDYAMGLRGWLLEAGLRHRATATPEGGWRLDFTRGLSAAQGSMPGLHHLVADAEGTVWACQRGPLVARIEPGGKSRPRSAAVTRKGSHIALDTKARRLVIADPELDRLVAVDADTLAVQEHWPAPGGPQLPLISPDGIICVTGHATGTLTIVRPQAGGFAEQTIEVGPGPHDPAVSADGDAVFVPCMGGDEVVKVTLADGRILGRTRVGQGPSHAKADHRRRRLYVANSWDGTLAAMSEDGTVLARAPSGGWAHAVEVTPDGQWVLVANFLDDTVTVFAADGLTPAARLETEAYPHGLDVARDGKRFVVTGFAADYARIFEVGSWRLLARVEVGRGGSHTAFAPDGDLAFIACSVDDHLAGLDLATGTVTARVTVQ